LRADQSVALGDQRPQSEHATLHARLDDPDDTRAFAIDRRQHRTFFSVGVVQRTRRSRAGRWRIDAVLLQLVQRASHFAPERTGSAGFHFGEHFDRANIRNAAERARDSSVRDPGLVFELAKSRYRVCRRDSRIKACLEQFSVVRIRFPRDTHLKCRVRKSWEPMRALPDVSSFSRQGARDQRKMKNLEAKFRLVDHAEAEVRAATIGYTWRSILNQRDTFFRVPNGKLKLREENGTAALIFYHRSESGPLMLSNYEIVPIAEPARTLRMLTDALGTIAIVEKVRTLMMREHIRLHLDRVANLGDFGEIEAVIAEGDDPEPSRAAVDEILAALGVAQPDLIEVSYFEMTQKA
jgi:predicted adenylyl cyclase CyaB